MLLAPVVVHHELAPRHAGGSIDSPSMKSSNGPSPRESVCLVTHIVLPISAAAAPPQQRRKTA